ncbi:LpqB family beta-propeller domain-containing protein [Nocardioides sp.]|uniref:LpqB family beta-propeller domain-containing protein n=1 Tax=Nocardioides sp. TaxID=35761 RepID=UPI002BE1C0BC|nr:LpqB family beta-propeller domain-containing protein [Nocardioides sp.]HXH80439.1 LpqB family beta-propeller domain-containing protein [Nocardioides sp.]
MKTLAARAALLLCTLLVMSACVRMPSEGPVTEVRTDTTDTTTSGIAYDPKPPQKGESATEIVLHFLEAMKATPSTTSVARQFLTADAQLSWKPEAIVTYGELGDPEGEREVALPMSSLEMYDERGAWQRSRDEKTQVFEVTVENGERRIAVLPDALIVPETWFAGVYRRVSLYFFDPTTQILVPEPVFVPEGDQLASSMVRGLLDDPTADPRVSRTVVPPGFESFPVPVKADGTAEVSLLGDPSAVDDERRDLILTQLVWTLRQDQRIRALQLAIGEEEQGESSEAIPVTREVGTAYDPTGAQASGDLFGLVDGRVVRGSIGSLTETSGAMGTERLGVRSIGVNLAGDRVAGVTTDGQDVLVAPVDEEVRAKLVASGGRNLLPPAWDFADRIWLADRARGGAVISVVIGDQSPRAINVPGMSGRDVRRLLVSRDGSRLVAVVRTPTGDRVVASRVLHNLSGNVLRATRAVVLDFQPAAATPVIRDIGWRSPTSISVLTDINDDLSQVATISVDGSPGELFLVGASSVRGGKRELVSSPVEGAEVFAVARDAVSDLTAPERPLQAPEQGLSSLTYVG